MGLGGDLFSVGLPRRRSLYRLDLSLDLSNTRITGEGVEALAGLPRFEELDLSETDVTDRGLAGIARVKRLKELDLSGTAITDDGPAALKPLARLFSLRLNHTAIGDAGILHLKPFKGIYQIELGHTRVTDRALTILLKQGPIPVFLDLRSTAVTPAAAKAFRRGTGGYTGYVLDETGFHP